MNSGAAGGTLTIEHVLNDMERPYYYNMLQTVSPDGQKTDSRVIELFKRSGLQNAQLKDIWIKYAGSTDQMSRLQFFTIMRVIALYQRDIKDVDPYLLARNFPYLPQIQGVPMPAIPNVNANPQHMNIAFAPLTDNDLRAYEDMIEKSQTSVRGLLKVSEAKSIFLQSKLDQTYLKAIWDLCDRAEDGSPGGKGYLKRNEWIVCFHLITYCKSGYPLPKTLPAELIDFLNRYNQTKLQAEHGISSASIIQPNPNMTSSSSNYNSVGPAPSTIIGQSTIINQQPNLVNRAVSLPTPGAPGQSGQEVNPEVISFIEKVIDSYKVLSKKYSDENSEYLQESLKNASAKASAIEELERELSGLETELLSNRTLKSELVVEAQKLSSQSSSINHGDLDKLTQLIQRPSLVEDSLQVLKAISQRFTEGMIKTPTAPLPSVNLGAPILAPTAGATPSIAKASEQEDDFFAGKPQEEEDMFS